MATIEGINFSNIQQRATVTVQGVWTHEDNADVNGKYSYDGGKAIMALDIDWNGAVLDSSTTINSTSDLLKYIKAKSNLTLGTTSTTAATGNHTHSNYLTKVLKLEKKGTSTIDLLANTTYTLTVGDQTLAFKTPTDQTGGGGTTVTDGSNTLLWNQNVTLATVGGVAIDAKLPTNPVTNDAIANLGFTKNAGTVTKVKVGSTEYTPSSGVVSLPAYPTVPTYSQGTNITIASNTISHATPTAKTNVKGNKTTKLLATITTDSQGHVTDYDVITPAELWNLVKQYADALYEPKSTTVAVTGISLNKSSLEVAANGTGTITATITPSNATNKNVTWTSNDTSVATVTASTTSGNAATVTWKKAGTVTITATAAGNTSKKATCTVACKQAQPTTTYYYSAGTTEVTTSNYTSANNAKSVTSVSSIPSSLDISSMKGYVYIVLPNTKEPNVVSAGGDFPNIAKTITSISGHTVYRVKIGTGATLTIVNSGSSRNDILN